MHWAYHPTEKAKIVDANEFYKLLANGWYDSPAKFPAVEKIEKSGEEAGTPILEPEIIPELLDEPPVFTGDIEENVLRETLEEAPAQSAEITGKKRGRPPKLL